MREHISSIMFSQIPGASVISSTGVTTGSTKLDIFSKLLTQWVDRQYTVYPKKYAHGFCFAVLCCGYTLTDFPISIRLTSLALWQSNDCPSASKATLMNMDKYFMWIHYERLHNHNKAKHNKTVCIFLGIYCNLRRETESRNNLQHSEGWHMWNRLILSWKTKENYQDHLRNEYSDGMFNVIKYPQEQSSTL